MRMPEPNTPGARLRAARLERRLSQVELADIAGFSRPHITHMELNTYRGGLASWEAVAGALGLSLDFLLNGGPSSSGFKEASAPNDFMVMPANDEDDDRFAEVSSQVSDMLNEEHMPSDTRTVARISAMVWRDVQKLPKIMPFEDRVALTLSERRSAIQAARAAMFSKVK